MTRVRAGRGPPFWFAGADKGVFPKGSDGSGTWCGRAATETLVGKYLVPLAVLAGSGAWSAAEAVLKHPRSLHGLEGLMGRRVHVVRLVRTWSYAGGGDGVERVGEDGLDGRLEAVSRDEETGTVRLEFGSEEMDRTLQLKEAEIERLGDAVTISTEDARVWIGSYLTGRAKLDKPACCLGRHSGTPPKGPSQHGKPLSRQRRAQPR